MPVKLGRSNIETRSCWKTLQWSVTEDCWSCADSVSNTEVQRRLRITVVISQTVTEWKLNFSGHVSLMLIKLVLFGIMERTNRRGWPKREWLNDNQEWCIYRHAQHLQGTAEQTSLANNCTSGSGHQRTVPLSPWIIKSNQEPTCVVYMGQQWLCLVLSPHNTSQIFHQGSRAWRPKKI